MKSEKQASGHYTDSLTAPILKEILSAQKSPCLSLYQNTHRQHPDNLQDPIRFRVLLKELEASLLRSYSSAEVQVFLKPFEALSTNHEFWNHTLEGLAVLGCPNYFRAVRIPNPVSELAIVADSFHTKPLRRFLQSVDRYQVLGVSSNQIKLFEGNRHALDEVELCQEVPRTIEQALGVEYTEPHLTVASYGGVGRHTAAMHHGHGAKKEETDRDTERFFRAVDHSIADYYSKPTGLPLILAALPEHHRLFHKVSQNPLLVSEGIKYNPDSISIEELQKMAWKLMEPQHKVKIDILTKEFELARSKKLGSDDLRQIAKASVSGRVKTLLIEANREIGGRVNAKTGKVDLDDITKPEVDDLLDDLGDLVEKMKGQVRVVPAEQMPSQTGLAATYRF